MRVRDERGWASRALDHVDGHPDGGLARALVPCGWLYAQGGRWLRRVRPDRPLPDGIPTVGVGNLRVGGTGKTPVVHDLMDRLQREGRRVGVVTRGYRAGDGADEPGWLRSQGAEVEIDADRRRGCLALAQRDVDLILLDDALQTRDRPRHTLALMLARDLARPPRPLPAGPARESEADAVDRAGLWLARHDGGFDPTYVDRDRHGGSPLLHFRLRPRSFYELRTGEEHSGDGPGPGPALAVSGLARPQSFERDLEVTGTEIAAAWRFEDHWTPTIRDLRRLEQDARRFGARCLICPEKNAQRLLALGQSALPLWALRSTVEWAGRHPLDEMGDWFMGGGQ